MTTTKKQMARRKKKEGLGIVKELVQKTLILRGTTLSFFCSFLCSGRKFGGGARPLRGTTSSFFLFFFLWLLLFWEENSEEVYVFFTNTTHSLFFLVYVTQSCVRHKSMSNPSTLPFLAIFVCVLCVFFVL